MSFYCEPCGKRFYKLARRIAHDRESHPAQQCAYCDREIISGGECWEMATPVCGECWVSRNSGVID